MVRDGHVEIAFMGDGGGAEQVSGLINQIGGAEAVAGLLREPESVKQKSPAVKQAVRSLINHLGGAEGVADKVVAALRGEKNEISGVVNSFLNPPQRAAAMTQLSRVRSEVVGRVNQLLQFTQ